MSLPHNKSQCSSDGLIKPWEEEWIVHQPYLLERGYRLPDRYHRDWIPSWHGTDKVPLSCPDSVNMRVRGVLEATRVSDGVRVVLKIVNTDEDIPILDYLNSPPLLSDPRNHTVPILDRIRLPGSNGLRVWIVMPVLLHFMDRTHPFRYVREVVEAIGQLLEGLEFMHEHGIAQRDACYYNLMVDSAKLMPHDDFSLHRSYWTKDWSGRVESRERRSVATLKYYFIDFETAIQYPREETNRLCVGRYGQVRGVPEFSDTVPYNPFKLDVYQLGSIIPRLLKYYDGMDFLKPLHRVMTLADPEKRPTAAQANAYFKQMISSFTEDDLSQGVYGKGLPYRDVRKRPKKKFKLWARISRLFVE